MQVRWRLSKRTLYSTLFTVLFYWFFLKKRKYTETFLTTLEAVDPKTAWEYLADFSNQAKFNPTIYEFEIDYEKGNYALWEYGVTYRENLVLLPFIRHENKAVFKVTPESHKGHKEPFRIDSDHVTCIFYFFCLRTEAQMSFRPGAAPKTTELEEIVTYECPPLLSITCENELRNQKALIHDRLIEMDFSAPF